MSIKRGRQSDSIVSICRAGLGDSLRTVITFTPSDYEVLYLRADLEGDRHHRRKLHEDFVDIERFGFASQGRFNQLSAEHDTEPEIGSYVATIRVFTNGFVARVIVGDYGVVVTTDELDIASFEDLAVAIRTLLAEQSARDLATMLDD